MPGAQGLTWTFKFISEIIGTGRRQKQPGMRLPGSHYPALSFFWFPLFLGQDLGTGCFFPLSRRSVQSLGNPWGLSAGEDRGEVAAGPFPAGAPVAARRSSSHHFPPAQARSERPSRGRRLEPCPSLQRGLSCFVPLPWPTAASSPAAPGARARGGPETRWPRAPSGSSSPFPAAGFRQCEQLRCLWKRKARRPAWGPTTGRRCVMPACPGGAALGCSDTGILGSDSCT